MATKKKALQAAAGAAGGGALAIEDVFSTYLYTGDGVDNTAIVNGIDLSGEGGLVWIKSRSTSSYPDHVLYDTERGINKQLSSNLTSAETTTAGGGVKAFNSDGFTIGQSSYLNDILNYASWTWRKAPRWFDVVTYTGDGVAGREIPHSLGCEVGTVIIKRTDSAAPWVVWHRGLGSDGLILNSSDAQQAYTFSGQVSQSTDSVFKVSNTTEDNASGATYVAYLYAHDPLGPSGDGSDGLIACDSFTDFTGSPTINLGWEPQWVFYKRASGIGDWVMLDTMRGFAVGASNDALLEANTSDAENTTFNGGEPEATGFKLSLTSGGTFIYIAIRRGPMRQPESGTEVFSPNLASGFPRYPSGFVTDAVYQSTRDSGSGVFYDRMRATPYLNTASTSAEIPSSYSWDQMDGSGANFSNTNYIGYSFRRAPGFFDVVAYTGDGVSGRTVPHNLGVAPEMMIVKDRGNATNWSVYSQPTGNTYALFLNLDFQGGVDPDYWNNTTPTDSVFTVGTQANVNGSSRNYIAYLFATLPGVSKVGSYTGNGSSQTIDCGFISGARFILIKRTDSTGDWYVWDTERGIVAANDPHLSLNTTAAEVTTDDSVDPDSSGFIVNQVAATNINVSSASYIYLAIA